MRTRLSLLLLPVAAGLLLAACQTSDDPADPTLRVLTLSPGIATIDPGGTVQLTATARDAAGNLTVPGEIRWYSSDEQVANLVGPGTVQGNTDGTTRIVATWDGVEGVAEVRVGHPQRTCPGLAALRTQVPCGQQ